MSTDQLPPEMLDAMLRSAKPFTDDEKAALERLLKIAKSDTGQSERVANFLLAWWNATNCGGFDLTDLWGLDDEITQDMGTIFQFLMRRNMYPDALEAESGPLSYKDDFQDIISVWRPALVEKP